MHSADACGRLPTTQDLASDTGCGPARKTPDPTVRPVNLAQQARAPGSGPPRAPATPAREPDVMITNESTSGALTDRVARLERSNQRLHGIVVLLVAAAALQTFWHFLPTPGIV